MEDKRLVEHYRGHEITCTADVEPAGWRYSVSLVLHTGDQSDVVSLDGDKTYASDLEALRAGIAAGRAAIDERATD